MVDRCEDCGRDNGGPATPECPAHGYRPIPAESPVDWRARAEKAESERDRLLAAIELAADDCVFFGREDTGPFVGPRAAHENRVRVVPFAAVNDVFAPAADAEYVPDDEIAKVYAAWVRGGQDAVVAWVAERRKAEPLPRYREARTERETLRARAEKAEAERDALRRSAAMTDDGIADLEAAWWALPDDARKAGEAAGPTACWTTIVRTLVAKRDAAFAVAATLRRHVRHGDGCDTEMYDRSRRLRNYGPCDCGRDDVMRDTADTARAGGAVLRRERARGVRDVVAYTRASGIGAMSTRVLFVDLAALDALADRIERGEDGPGDEHGH